MKKHTILSMNEQILANSSSPSELDNCPSLIGEINKEVYRLFDVRTFSSGDNSKLFFEANPILNAYFNEVGAKHKEYSKLLRDEWYYSNKLGYQLQGFPSKYAYLIHKSMKINKTPNRVIKSLGFRGIDAICKYDVLGALNTLFGYEVELIRENKPMVTNGGLLELYVSNIDDVLITKPDIKDKITHEDIVNISYTKGKGVTVGDVPLRVLVFNVPIVYNELDWSEV